MTRIITGTPASHFRVLARCCEPVWLAKFCKLVLRNPENDNGPLIGGAA